MKLAVIESPYAGNVELNTDYARACLADALSLGEAPIASHLLYTQPGVLNDNDPDERRQGIAAGFAWGKWADVCAMYTDLGVSDGMREGVRLAESEGIPVEERSIGWQWAKTSPERKVHVEASFIVNSPEGCRSIAPLLDDARAVILLDLTSRLGEEFGGVGVTVTSTPQPNGPCAVKLRFDMPSLRYGVVELLTEQATAKFLRMVSTSRGRDSPSAPELLSTGTSLRGG